VDWLVPWHPYPHDGAAAQELARELPRRHVLAGIPVKAIGFRQDCDDVAFELLDGTCRIAVVHLTYTRESNPRWPHADLYADEREFVAQRLLPDHAGYAG
jgi:hypothetical protein